MPSLQTACFPFIESYDLAGEYIGSISRDLQNIMTNYTALYLLLFVSAFQNTSADISPKPAFSEASRFSSLDELRQSALAFAPSANKTSWGYLFSAREVGQPELSSTGTVIVANNITDASVVWQSEEKAVVLLISNPPTAVARSEVGVILLLSSNQNKWRISDYLKYSAMGSAARVSCKLATSIGDHFVEDRSTQIFLTIEVDEGGRGLSHSEFQTLLIDNSRLLKIVP